MHNTGKVRLSKGYKFWDVSGGAGNSRWKFRARNLQWHKEAALTVDSAGVPLRVNFPVSKLVRKLGGEAQFELIITMRGNLSA